MRDPAKSEFPDIRLHNLLEGQFELLEQSAAALQACTIFVTAHHRVHQFEMCVAGQQIGIDRLDAR